MVASRDRFAELIAVHTLTPGIALLGLLLAGFLGAVHALSPGHGKTVVGAYLVGSRGTPRHAAFLGLTVTVTHTAGVFALGLLTLFAFRRACCGYRIQSVWTATPRFVGGPARPYTQAHCW
jgi:ABC-type nickel/cobalt efflux system permease component RcnA